MHSLPHRTDPMKLCLCFLISAVLIRNQLFGIFICVLPMLLFQNLSILLSFSISFKIFNCTPQTKQMISVTGLREGGHGLRFSQMENNSAHSNLFSDDLIKFHHKRNTTVHTWQNVGSHINRSIVASYSQSWQDVACDENQ